MGTIKGPLYIFLQYSMDRASLCGAQVTCRRNLLDISIEVSEKLSFRKKLHHLYSGIIFRVIAYTAFLQKIEMLHILFGPDEHIAFVDFYLLIELQRMVQIGIRDLGVGLDFVLKIFQGCTFGLLSKISTEYIITNLLHQVLQVARLPKAPVQKYPIGSPPRLYPRKGFLMFFLAFTGPKYSC